MLTSIGQIPAQAAARYGEATALAIEGQEISFADLDRRVGRLLGLKGPSGVDEIILLGRTAPAEARCLDELLEGQPPDRDPVEVPAEALSTIAYTSGTTGHPCFAA